MFCASVWVCVGLNVACAVCDLYSLDQALFASVIRRGSGSCRVLHLLPQHSEPGPGHSQPHLTPFHKLLLSQNSLSILLVIQKGSRVPPSLGQRSLLSPLATVALVSIIRVTLSRLPWTRGAQGVHPVLWSQRGIATPSFPSSCLTQHLLLRDKKKGGLHRDPDGLPLNSEVAPGSPCLSFPTCDQQDTDTDLASTPFSQGCCGV